MNQERNVYNPQRKPLPFPTADLEFQRVQNNYIPMTRVSPTNHDVPAPSPAARDVVDSPRVHIDVPYIDGNGSGSEYRDEPRSIHVPISTISAPLGTIHPDEMPDFAPQYRYFLSVRTLLESLAIVAGKTKARHGYYLLVCRCCLIVDLL